MLYEGPYELSDALSLAFLYLLDMPSTRKYIRAGHDMEVHNRATYSLLYLLSSLLGCFFGVYGLLYETKCRGKAAIECKGHKLDVEVMARLAFDTVYIYHGFC